MKTLTGGNTFDGAIFGANCHHENLMNQYSTKVTTKGGDTFDGEMFGAVCHHENWMEQFERHQYKVSF